MKLLTQAQCERLRANSIRQDEDPERGIDFEPVVKLFVGNATWLLTEMDENGICFGLCDLGQGFPELGSVSLAELETYRGFPPIERDRYFNAEKALSAYAAQAREHQQIIA